MITYEQARDIEPGTSITFGREHTYKVTVIHDDGDFIVLDTVRNDGMEVPITESDLQFAEFAGKVEVVIEDVKTDEEDETLHLRPDWKP